MIGDGEMREIKFRAWDKQDKRMIIDEQDFIPLKVTSKGVLKLSPHHVENLWSFVDGDRIDIMQFTGIQDKKGNGIYEGDIVLLDIMDVQNNESLTISAEDRNEMYKRDLKIISYQQGSFGFYPVYPELNYVDDVKWCPFLDENGELWTQYMKIVGNIYENPELLK